MVQRCTHSIFPEAINDIARKESLLEKMYMSNIFMSLDHKSNFEVLKNRWGPNGKNISIEDTIEIFSQVIATMMFKNERVMFQEAMRTNVRKAVIKTVRKVINMEGGDNHYDTIC